MSHCITNAMGMHGLETVFHCEYTLLLIIVFTSVGRKRINEIGVTHFL